MNKIKVKRTIPSWHIQVVLFKKKKHFNFDIDSSNTLTVWNQLIIIISPCCIPDYHSFVVWGQSTKNNFA